MKSYLKTLLLFLVIACISACGSRKKRLHFETADSYSMMDAPMVNFMDNAPVQDVLARAQSEDKPIFADIYTTWCAPCRMMDQDVFTNQDLADYLNENFITYKVDAEDEKNGGMLFAINYEAKTYPTILFLDKYGNVLERKDGAAFFTELRKMGDNALEKSKFAVAPVETNENGDLIVPGENTANGKVERDKADSSRGRSIFDPGGN